MNVDDMLQHTNDAITVRRVYGEPIERDGALIIPAAKVAGGAGGGSDDVGNGGGGFGVNSRPAGVFVVRPGGDVSWQPALDINRIVLGGQVVVIVALLVLRSILKRR
jgi:uncharacterized spore protein YtfJ